MCDYKKGILTINGYKIVGDNCPQRAHPERARRCCERSACERARRRHHSSAVFSAARRGSLDISFNISPAIFVIWIRRCKALDAPRGDAAASGAVVSDTERRATRKGNVARPERQSASRRRSFAPAAPRRLGRRRRRREARV